MADLSFSLDEPPARPPKECGDELMWHLSFRLFVDHRPDADGFCITCIPSEFIPCVARHLAVRGLLASCGVSEPGAVR